MRKKIIGKVIKYIKVGLMTDSCTSWGTGFELV